jgi:hypothetical protein
MFTWPEYVERFLREGRKFYSVGQHKANPTEWLSISDAVIPARPRQYIGLALGRFIIYVQINAYQLGDLSAAGARQSMIVRHQV